ncbi:hypothetical protein IJG04_00530 [Candidatus Saccharibacteria bacterium]|nr:hypothetical protein [Candidatus Saccharibacteria bacterium]
MQKYRQTLLAGRLINLTDKPFHIYDDTSGDIVEAKPERGYHFSPEERDMTAYYVINKKMFNKIKISKCCLEKFAVIDDQSRGRNNVMIAHLVWAGDPDITVRLHKKYFESCALFG